MPGLEVCVGGVGNRLRKTVVGEAGNTGTSVKSKLLPSSQDSRSYSTELYVIRTLKSPAGFITHSGGQVLWYSPDPRVFASAPLPVEGA